MRALIVIFVLVVAAPALAQDVQFERDVLRSIDTVPTRAQLDAIPHVRPLLEAAALDDEREMWIRHRAITLLSQYPDDRTRAFLVELVKHDDHHIRRMAVYTLARTFGKSADLDLMVTLSEVIKDDESEEVVKWAVRSLRWVHHDDAIRLLQGLSRRDDARGRIAALALERTTYSPAPKE